jgi:alkylhydroperoxidase family enzyme
MTWLAIERSPGSSELDALLALHPETGDALRDLVSSAQASVDPAIFELVVLRSAQLLDVDRAVVEELVALGTAVSAHQVAALHNWPSSNAFSAKERLAIAYAEQFVIDHTLLEDADIARMLEAFSVSEFFRLQVSIGIIERVLRVCRLFEITPMKGRVS